MSVASVHRRTGRDCGRRPVRVVRSEESKHVEDALVAAIDPGLLIGNRAKSAT